MSRSRSGTPQRIAGRVLLAALLLSGVATQARAQAQPDDFRDKLLLLATGQTGGTFRLLGEMLCDETNADRVRTLVRCVPVVTAGSDFNLQAVENGSVQLGISQEDLLATRYAEARPAGASVLRTVAFMHASPIAIVVRKTAGIASLPGIRGKIVNVGNRGSGQHRIALNILAALQLRPEDLGGVRYAPTSEHEAEFCQGRVDFVVEAVAHPSGLYRKLLECGGEFLPLSPEIMERMKASNPFLTAMEIPAGTYPGQAMPLATLGLRNVLFTSTQVGHESIFRFTRLLSGRFEELRAGQPLLQSVQPLATGIPSDWAVPLHTGARRALAGATP